MTRLALVRISDGVVISAPIAPGTQVELPGVGQVSPAVADWEGGGALSYQDGVAVEGPPQFRLAAVVDFVMPEGKQISGPATYAYDAAAGSVVETIPVEDVPAPYEPTPADKLAAAGLSVADLKQLLGLS